MYSSPKSLEKDGLSFCKLSSALSVAVVLTPGQQGLKTERPCWRPHFLRHVAGVGGAAGLTLQATGNWNRRKDRVCPPPSQNREPAVTHQDVGKRVPCGGSCRVAAEEMIVQVTFRPWRCVFSVPSQRDSLPWRHS